MSSPKSETYEDLRLRIITNELRPGEPLNEKELMSQYKIGRTPLREIFLLLKKDGLINIISRLGTIVSSHGIREIREIIEIRRELEGFVGQLAAERITDEQLSTLKQILQKVDGYKVKNYSDVKKIGEYERRFHHTMYEATGNHKIRTFLTELQSIMARFWHHMELPLDTYLNAFDDLEQIFKAVENKDMQRARKASVQHIDSFVSRVKEGFL